MKQITLNDIQLENDDIFVFEFTQEGDMPCTASGATQYSDGSVGVTLSVITKPIERKLCDTVNPGESRRVLILHLYQPGSIDALIAQALKAKEMLEKTITF